MLGSVDPLVTVWQLFLRGGDYYTAEITGKFDKSTQEATKSYQWDNDLVADGIVGNRTWGQAMVMGLEMIETPLPGTKDPNWPPSAVSNISAANRLALFGRFDFVPAPTKNNPEGIKIKGNWVTKNIVKISLPQIKGLPGSGPVWINSKIVQQTQDLFDAWEKAGLSKLLLSWGGCWSPRFIRGSRTNLSNHSLGTAFDINVPWNMLGRQPALVGTKGSVRELVPLANEYGFFWGGHYPTRKDGMHFEAVKIL